MSLLHNIFDFSLISAKFPAADTATMSALMASDKVVGAIRETVNQSAVLLYGNNTPGSSGESAHTGNPTEYQGIAKSSEGVTPGETSVKLRLHTQNGIGGGYRLENERFSQPGDDKYALAADPLRYYYAQFRLTGQLLQAASAGEKSFKPAFQEASDRLVRSSAMDVNQAAHGNGVGVRATIRNNEAAAQTVIDVDTTIRLRVGNVIDGLTISTGVVIEPARTVTAVDRTNRTITVSPALTTGMTATTDGWVIASSDSTIAAPNNSWNREINGLDKIVAATGTLHGLSPSLYTQWASYVATGVGAIGDSALRLAKDTVGFETGLNEKGLNFVLITTRGIRTNYADTLMPQRRTVNTQTLSGGFDAVMFDDSPIFVDDACTPGVLYGLRVPKLLWAVQSDWDWMDRDGAVLARVPGRDQYIATLFTYHQLMTTERGAHFRLSGITDTVR
jgi:hypothetical protein